MHWIISPFALNLPIISQWKKCNLVNSFSKIFISSFTFSKFLCSSYSLDLWGYLYSGKGNIISVPTHRNQLFKISNMGLPSWHSCVKFRGHGFEPWSGKIPHAAEQLSPCTTTTEPALYSPWATTTEPTNHNCWAYVPQLLQPTHLEPVLRNKTSHCNEKPAHHNKE